MHWLTGEYVAVILKLFFIIFFFVETEFLEKILYFAQYGKNENWLQNQILDKFGYLIIILLYYYDANTNKQLYVFMWQMNSKNATTVRTSDSAIGFDVFSEMKQIRFVYPFVAIELLLF